MSAPYPFAQFEPKWQSVWQAEQTFRTPNPGDADFDATKPKFYVLDMFPYPSGSGLHVGHPEGYTATDIIGRAKRRQGFNVLHPMGWDSFGLPAEQYAIKTGQHPRVTTEQNIANFKRQLQSIGFGYDWSREIATTDPGYVRWTQWIFLQLYHSYYDADAKKAKPVADLEAKGWTPEQIDAVRLAFIHEAPVNWSPDLGTVLANEEVEEWKSKGHIVERRPLRQWMLRITAYAQRLIDDLEPLDWPKGIKLLQTNWIGRSEGAEVEFTIGSEKVTVFTTRPDTLFGATYMVLAPEHPLVASITTPAQSAQISAYLSACASKSDMERGELNKEKSGVFTGAFAKNPANNEEIPVWIADYVMMGYGTGAIMAVPAHDKRDFEFATKFSLPIRQVVQPENPETPWQGFTEHGTAIHSEFLNGLSTPEAKEKMISWLAQHAQGTRCINYKLRDWLFSRQRYWGEPFPILWENGKHRAIPASELPLLQPEMENFKPTGDPRGPLINATDWIQYSETAQRETNTMPQWAGSCWYYLRYCDPKNDQNFIGKNAESYWSDPAKNAVVDLYVGGTEHAVLHLLYARFWHKVLFDLGHLSTSEPFYKLVNQGLILGEDGQKMSKSRGNVVNPDDVIHAYGADSLRLYEMFMGPLEQVKPWSMNGVEGVSRFLARVWRLLFPNPDAPSERNPAIQHTPCTDKKLRRIAHHTIKKVTEDIEKLAFNTAISEMMIFTNALQDAAKQSNLIPLEELTHLLHLLNPFAPHLTEELYAQLQNTFPHLPAAQLANQTWPTFAPSALEVAEMEIIIQINGKLRERITVDKSISQTELESLALALPKISDAITSKEMKKIIYVPGRILNLVVVG